MQVAARRSRLAPAARVGAAEGSRSRPSAHASGVRTSTTTACGVCVLRQPQAVVGRQGGPHLVSVEAKGPRARVCDGRIVVDEENTGNRSRGTGAPTPGPLCYIFGACRRYPGDVQVLTPQSEVELSPILVRPVREQLEHDRVIRLLQAKYKRKFDVAINPGHEQTAPVGAGPVAVVSRPRPALHRARPPSGGRRGGGDGRVREQPRGDVAVGRFLEAAGRLPPLRPGVVDRRDPPAVRRHRHRGHRDLGLSRRGGPDSVRAGAARRRARWKPTRPVAKAPRQTGGQGHGRQARFRHREAAGGRRQSRGTPGRRNGGSKNGASKSVAPKRPPPSKAPAGRSREPAGRRPSARPAAPKPAGKPAKRR